MMDSGSLLGRALVRRNRKSAVHLSARLTVIELRKGDKWEDYTDWDKLYGKIDSGSKSGLAGRVVSQAEGVGRFASDLAKWRAAKQYERAQVGQFKITENSPNTARISVGPDQRERRNKYTWERVGFKRGAAKLGLAAVAVTAAAVGKRYGKMGGFIPGAKQDLGVVTAAGKNVGKRIGQIFTGKSFAPTAIPKIVTEHEQLVAAKGQLADIAAKNAARNKKRKAAAAAKKIGSNVIGMVPGTPPAS